jgi:hypothetical protein
MDRLPPTVLFLFFTKARYRPCFESLYKQKIASINADCRCDGFAFHSSVWNTSQLTVTAGTTYDACHIECDSVTCTSLGSLSHILTAVSVFALFCLALLRADDPFPYSSSSSSSFSSGGYRDRSFCLPAHLQELAQFNHVQIAVGEMFPTCD